MKYLLSVLFCLFLLACRNPKQPKPFSPEMLVSQLFLINSSEDTVINTLHGSVLRITANSFSVSGEVQIEIKEAFTALEMLAGGMTTESNGRLLRSGGMIFINATVEGNATELIKPISVSIPNNYYDNNMEVFKGVETDSGTINWVDPFPVDTSFQSRQWNIGKTIYQSKCAPCHILGKDFVGPNLANVEERIPDRKRILEFVNNPVKAMSSNPYFQCLKYQYGTVMTGFPDLTSNDIDAILNYINAEVAKNPLLITPVEPCVLPVDTSSNSTAGFSSLCENDTIYIPRPRNETTFLAEQSAEIIERNDTLKEPLNPESLEGLRQGFTDINPSVGMYDFEVRTLGWYNIDAFVAGYAGTTSVALWANLQIDFDITMHVYLFCPDKKMLSIGYSSDNKKYYFDKLNGAIPLFESDRAILFAFGSKRDKMYYGISEFVIQKEQVINITVKETTEKKLLKALKSKAIEGIDIGIEKKKRKIVPRNCDDDISFNNN